MSSGKLRLKRTPAEQAERDLRKARKAARKAAKRGDKYIDDYTEHDHARKRRRTDDDHGPSWDALDDSDAEYGPQPAASGSGSHRAHKVDYDYIKAQVEEERFREKMFGAMDDDDRLDSVEAALNSYAHVPRRWRGGGMDRMDDELDIQPQHMEDEDYAEWIRAGMWRKKHAAEHEEQMRRQAEHKAREEREKALREETRRLERAAEEERRMRKRVKERMREVEARELYDTRWKAFLAPASVASEDQMLRFEDIPWPVMASAVSLRDEQHARVRIEDLTAEAISSFLLPAFEHDAPSADPSKERKEKLRETMLRFHPDKFEGRIMKRVREKDRERVQEAVGIVARTLNSLMGEAK
ncbi:hypothetical protein OH76DRAFT_1456727 [Lentinus brumalis]|uniref:Uncharacterized protein n=1 Tax=Lentinus brumalis TaxID=2498619 RepID=A0A371D4I2_9APHY|nr:hypothetical protein OH76DRAFT_1456727 [Polyporus brumalis]